MLAILAISYLIRLATYSLSPDRSLTVKPLQCDHCNVMNHDVLIERNVTSKSGQGVVEYALMGLVVGFVMIAIATNMGGARSTLFDTVRNMLIRTADVIRALADGMAPTL